MLFSRRGIINLDRLPSVDIMDALGQDWYEDGHGSLPYYPDTDEGGFAVHMERRTKTNEHIEWFRRFMEKHTFNGATVNLLAKLYEKAEAERRQQLRTVTRK